MMVLAWIRFVAAALFLVVGTAVFVLSVLGVYKFNYVLNRMHVAATGDTMGLFCVLVGLLILNGLDASALKIIMILVFFWITSPVCSHMLCKVEAETNEEIDKECEVMKP
jgi:multicomponent Na+:H+ antiporter subunit G